MAHRAGDDLTLVRVLLLTLEANRVPATLGRRIAETDELFTLAAQVDDPVVVGIAAMRSLRVKIESGTFDQADGLVEILDEYARFDPYVLANSTSARAVLAHARGEFDDGLDLADRALEISHSEPDARAVHLSFISMIKRERGELAELLPTLEYVVETYPGVTGFHPLLGLAYVAAGQHEAAETLLQHEIDTGLTDHPMNPLWLASVALVALLAIELESVPAAEMLTPVLEPWAGRPATSVVSYYGFVDELLGFLALVRDDIDAADQHFRAAIELTEPVGARVSHTSSRLGLARVHAARGQTADAIEEAVAVESAATAIGMTRAAATASSLAAQWTTQRA
jgi:tetratricopeptide (TPR) repeat protein